MSLFAAPVFKDSNIRSGRNGLPEALCQLNRAVMRIIVIDEAADKTDENVLWNRRFNVERPAFESFQVGGENNDKNSQRDYQRSKCSESAHAIPNNVR